MHDQRAHSGERGSIGDRIIERVDDFDRLQRLATATIEAASEVEAPMIDHGGGELALLRDWMNEVRPFHPVRMRRSRDVVDIEAGDCGGHDASVAVDHRMMNQREEEIRHLRLSTAN